MGAPSPCAVPLPATRRLRLRELEPPDAPQLAAISNSRDLARMMVNVPHPYSQHDALRLIDGGVNVNRSGRGLMAGAVRKATSVLIGVGAAVLVDIDTATISYWLGEPYWGRGYGSELVGALVTFAFASWNVRRITAKTFADNVASLKLQSRLGFEPSGAACATSIARQDAAIQIETVLLAEKFKPIGRA